MAPLLSSVAGQRVVNDKDDKGDKGDKGNKDDEDDNYGLVGQSRR